jgi:hypothetical protein
MGHIITSKAMMKTGSNVRSASPKLRLNHADVDSKLFRGIKNSMLPKITRKQTITPNTFGIPTHN